MLRSLTILWYVLTLKCEEADRLRAISPPDRLKWWESWGAFLHAVGCRSCWAARRQLHTLHDLSRQIAEQEADQKPATQTLSSDAKARLADALSKKPHDAE